MRILLLATSFNALTQRIHVELAERGHELSVELDVNDDSVTEAVRLFRPDLVVAPFLRRAIPEAVWRTVRCLIVHPGPVGDRGPAALDWAILEDHAAWGTTLIEANATFDAGNIWATRNFDLRAAAKSSLYRDEVTEAAVACVIEAIGRIEGGGTTGRPLSDASPGGGSWRPAIKIEEREIDWSCDETGTVMRKLHAASGQPGIPDITLGLSGRLHDPWPEDVLRGPAGAVIAWRDGAICRATVDGAVWITAITPEPAPGSRRFKIPATLALAGRLDGIPEQPIGLGTGEGPNTFREVSYRETNGVGWLSFEFLNGAMSVDQCRRLLEAYRYAAARPTKVIVLAGGREFWSNGMHLGVIEAAASPGDASWANINAIDDVACAVLLTADKLVIAALEGNAGAGGVFSRSPRTKCSCAMASCSIRTTRTWAISSDRNTGPTCCRGGSGRIASRRSSDRACPWGRRQRSGLAWPTPCCPMRGPPSVRPCKNMPDDLPPIRRSIACSRRNERGASARRLRNRSRPIGPKNWNACGSASTASIRAITWRAGASLPASRSRARRCIWRVTAC